MVEPPTNGSERILAKPLFTFEGPVNLVSVYTPTLSSSSDIKDQFYDQLNITISKIPKHKYVFLLSDFNARVGAWTNSIGQHKTGKKNGNGQRLLDFYSYYYLCVTNSFFQTKSQNKVSWKPPRSGYWHRLDLIITRHTNLNTILITCSYQSAVCNTDHSLVCSKVRLKPKKIHRFKVKGCPHINLSAIADQ
ncbi:unnamed protein product [Natator depressus]